jgi:hypothetical protein
VHPAAQVNLVSAALPQHVQDVIFGPGRQRCLAQAGAQRGRVARPPHPRHIVAVGQPASGVLRGGAAPVGWQQRPPAVRDRFPAGGSPLCVGDGRVAARDLLAVVIVGPDSKAIPGGPSVHATNISSPGSTLCGGGHVS